MNGDLFDDDGLQQLLQYQQQLDRQEIERDLLDVIRHAENLGLPKDEANLLRWRCGVDS